MSEIRSHRDLVAWQKAVELCVAIYEATKAFPSEERFGLVSQLRRAGVSVPSNIAEGYGRGSRQDYVRFLRAARGSLYEIDTQLLLSCRLGFLTEAAFQQIESQANECSRILFGLIRSLDSDTSP